MSDMQDCCPIDIKNVKAKAITVHAAKAYIYGEYRYSLTLYTVQSSASCPFCFTPENDKLNRRVGMPHS